MLFPKTRPWNWLTPGILAFCMAPMIAAIDANRTHEPWVSEPWVSEPWVSEPWPMLLSNDPGEMDPDIALLQLRANVMLARLIESGQTAEERR